MQAFTSYKDALDKIRDLESALSCAKADLFHAEFQLDETLADRIVERFKEHAEFLPSCLHGHYRMGSWFISIYAIRRSAPRFVWEAVCEEHLFRASPSRGLRKYDARTHSDTRAIPTARAAPKVLLFRNADSIDAWLDELIQYLLDLQNVKPED